jgi:hypothetical protein
MAIRTASTVACLSVILVFGMIAATAAQVAEPTGDPAVAAFSASVERYADLRARFAAPLPPLRASRGEWSTLVARRFLASAIRTARRDARPGSIFTSPVAALFEQRIAAALTPAERLVLAGADDEESAAPIALPNEPLAADWLTPLPSRLAMQLPPLPVAIEYRLVGASLVLWDVDAEIVIDVLPGALN